MQMWSGMTLKRLKANAVPIPSKPQSSKVLNGDASMQPLDMQCHASVGETSHQMLDNDMSRTVSTDDSLEITGVSSVALDLEVISEISDDSRWESEMESLAADVISTEHTYSRSGLCCKN